MVSQLIKVDREKIMRLADGITRSERWVVSELDISLQTYCRRMEIGWRRDGLLALCFLLYVTDPTFLVEK